MDKKKIIIIAAAALVAGGCFYLFYYRTLNAVTPADVQTLQQYKVVASSGTPAAPATITSAVTDLSSAASSILSGQ